MTLALDILDREIKALSTSGAICDVYRDHLGAETIRGRIVYLSTKLVAIAKCDDYGRYDGATTVRTEDVTMLRWEGLELKTLSQNIDEDSFPKDLSLTGFSSLDECILSTHLKYGYVTLFCEASDPDVCYIGKIADHDATFVLLDEYGTSSTLDKKKLIVRKDDITRIDADGPYEKYLQKNIG